MSDLVAAFESRRALVGIVIATDHDEVDYRAVVRHARLVVDTRNAC